MLRLKVSLKSSHIDPGSEAQAIIIKTQPKQLHDFIVEQSEGSVVDTCFPCLRINLSPLPTRHSPLLPSVLVVRIFLLLFFV
jgi:hypothetical protein